MSATSVSPGVRARVQRNRRGIVVVAVVLIGAVILAWAGRGSTRGYLDPDAYDDAGGRAVAELLRDQGVEVVKATRSADVTALLADAVPTTLLVAIPDLLTESQVDAVVEAAAETTVLVAPGDGPLLAAVAPGVVPVGINDADTVLEPGCAWPAAVRAGRADAAGATYRAGGGSADPGTGAVSCYSLDGRASVVHGQRAGASFTVLGDPAVLQNDTLAREGNAALALNALGEQPRVVWYLPSIADTGDEQQSFLSLAPDWVLFAGVQLGVVVVLLALARTRRFGPVVAEPLPTVVPASETIEGRGRLYRRSRSRDAAAAALRAGTLERLRVRCGLPRDATTPQIIESTSRATGRTPHDVGTVLIGAVPGSDAELIALAQHLRALEKELT